MVLASGYSGPAARLVYKRHACVAVSPSTVTAMRERLDWTGDIYLIPNGAPRPGPPGPPAASRSLTWVGRLVAHKRAELLLPVAQRLAGSGLTVDVAGRGPAAAALAAAAEARGLGSTLRLHGLVTEERKRELVAGSLLHLNTSQGEGWGLCVLEAAALGVPTVAFDVPGLRDAIWDGRTGWLVRDGESIEDVTERAIKELADPARRRAIAAACRRWAASLSWDRSAERMAALIAASVRYASSRGTRPGASAAVGCSAPGSMRLRRCLALEMHRTLDCLGLVHAGTSSGPIAASAGASASASNPPGRKVMAN